MADTREGSPPPIHLCLITEHQSLPRLSQLGKSQVMFLNHFIALLNVLHSDQHNLNNFALTSLTSS